MTRPIPTPQPTPEHADPARPVVVVVDRNECGFGPCPITDCDWGNWGDMPVCRQHYVNHMASIITDDDAPNDLSPVAASAADTEPEGD